MIRPDEFCCKCEILIPRAKLSGRLRGEQFKDGFYCDNCAKAKLESARTAINNWRKD